MARMYDGAVKAVDNLRKTGVVPCGCLGAGWFSGAVTVRIVVDMRPTSRMYHGAVTAVNKSRKTGVAPCEYFGAELPGGAGAV